MKIIRFEIFGLNDRDAITAAELDSDLNILTGRNGAGKTNVLKLLWYIISGNIFLALKEVPFSKAILVTDLYEITVHRISHVTCRIEYYSADEGRLVFEDEEESGEEFGTFSAEDYANSRLRELGGSVFFPTFRRIEGGFTLDIEPQGRAVSGKALLEMAAARPGANIERLFLAAEAYLK